MTDQNIETDGLPADEEDLSDVIANAVEQQKTGGQPDDEETGPARDEKGRFASIDDRLAEAQKGRSAPRESTEQASERAPDGPKQISSSGAEETGQRPPPGFSPASKAAWDQFPQHLKDDIAKREQEIDQGFKRYNGLGQFAELAERNGTNIATAVAAYNHLENKFIQDPVAGLEEVCQRLNIDPRILTSAMQMRFGGMYEQQTASHQPQQQYQAPGIEPEALINEAVRRFQQQQETRDINSQIEAFAADPANKFLHNVLPDMVAVLQTGRARTLKEAYNKALRLNEETYAIMHPQTAAPQAKTPAEIANQARAAAKAVRGSPRPGLRPGAVPEDLTLEETTKAALAAVRGRV